MVRNWRDFLVFGFLWAGLIFLALGAVYVWCEATKWIWQASGWLGTFPWICLNIGYGIAGMVRLTEWLDGRD